MMRVFGVLLASAALIFGENGETLLEQGAEQFHDGQYTDARKSFEKALALSPADARAITWVAITKAALGDCGISQGELKLQAGRNPDLEIRKLAGIAFIQCQLPRNQFSEIIPVLVGLQRVLPDDPDVLFEASQVYLRAANFEVHELQHKAASSYRANQLTAEIYEAQGKHAEAAAEYEKAIGKNPVALELHYRLGNVLLLRSQDAPVLDKAHAQFEAELKLNPGNAAAEYQAAQIDLSRKKGEEAARHFEKAIDLAPGFAEALIGLGKLRLDEKDHSEAISLMERAVKAQPNLEQAHYNLMLAYRAAGKNKDAQRQQKELDKLQRDKTVPARP